MNISNEQSLDHAALSDLREATEEMFTEIIEAFLEDSPKRLHSLSEAVSISDINTMKEESHGLKGSSGNIGAVKLSKICEEIEARSKDNLITNQAELIQHAIDEFEHINRELSKLITN